MVARNKARLEGVHAEMVKLNPKMKVCLYPLHALLYARTQVLLGNYCVLGMQAIGCPAQQTARVTVLVTGCGLVTGCAHVDS